jgi:hypothetical protein
MPLSRIMDGICMELSECQREDFLVPLGTVSTGIHQTLPGTHSMSYQIDADCRTNRVRPPAFLNARVLACAPPASWASAYIKYVCDRPSLCWWPILPWLTKTTACIIRTFVNNWWKSSITIYYYISVNCETNVRRY